MNEPFVSASSSDIGLPQIQVVISKLLIPYFQMFNSVSILFSDVVTFTEICSRITPMEVVSMLNAMYSIFDTLTERNRVYKVRWNSKSLPSSGNARIVCVVWRVSKPKSIYRNMRLFQGDRCNAMVCRTHVDTGGRALLDSAIVTGSQVRHLPVRHYYLL